MKNRVSGVSEAREIIADFHGRRINLLNKDYKGSHGVLKWENKPVVRIIPMHYSDKKNIDDVEILVNKSKNSYFSIGMILRKKSWVKGIQIGEIDFKIKQSKIIHPLPKDDETWIRIARYINLLKIRAAVQL